MRCATWWARCACTAWGRARRRCRRGARRAHCRLRAHHLAVRVDRSISRSMTLLSQVCWSWSDTPGGLQEAAQHALPTCYPTMYPGPHATLLCTQTRLDTQVLVYDLGLTPAQRWEAGRWCGASLPWLPAGRAGAPGGRGAACRRAATVRVEAVGAGRRAAPARRGALAGRRQHGARAAGRSRGRGAWAARGSGGEQRVV